MILIFTFATLTSCKEEKKEVQNFKVRDHDKHASVEIRKGQTKLINPLLDCYDFDETTNRDAKNLEKKIADYINDQIDKNNITEASVYYRDLNNGPWIGINEDANYSPASLLKVPMMIAAYRQTEDEPDFLNKLVLYKDYGDQFVQGIKDEQHALELNKEYTIERLVEEMIVKSDNVSKNLIYSNLNPKYYRDVYYDLGIDIFKYHDASDYLSVKDYASYFRILYNATYLNKTMSEKALNLLTKAEFKYGIVAGVPSEILVAHKFGERWYFDTNIKQLHDCGIIYKPGSPYLLCVMVKGTDFSKMASVIQGISKKVYYETGFRNNLE